jgi:predicted transcriptional regulator
MVREHSPVRQYVFPSRLPRYITAKIVAAYVRRNQVPPAHLPGLIATVHEALGRLATPAMEPISARSPAVLIRQSVRRDYVVCVECGYRGQMLRRHLTTAHGLSVEQYRARWNLPRDHAMTVPAYSERRSTMAKRIGLGRGRGTSGVSAQPAAAPQPRRRGRPRLAATAT